MTLPILICDDSSLARRQMARALPEEWNVNISFAASGAEAITAIEQGQAHVMFLDLNMPEMSSYDVLSVIRQRDLPTLVLVVSGDIQSEARHRVMKLGALEFLRKPVSADRVRQVLQRYGLIEKHTLSEIARESDSARLRIDKLSTPSFMDALRETTNIAMGAAGRQLGQLLSTFIKLPVPTLHHCSYERLPELLHVNKGLSATAEQSGHTSHPAVSSGACQLSAVSHGFKAPGVTGEGVVMLRSHDILRLDALMDQDLPHHNAATRTLIDLSEMLLGACLKGLGDQLDLEFHHSYPVLLGHEKNCADLLRCRENDQSVLAIEIRYELTSPGLDCYLLLLFTDDSRAVLEERVTLLTA